MNVLMIGATGMLGRPVARRLVDDGFALRIITRDADRARTVLPKGVEIHSGDLRDEQAMIAAMGQIDAIYINLAAPMAKRSPPYEPELHGTQAIVSAAGKANARRIVRISALGVDDAADQWWAARHKFEADNVVMNSGLEWTIFRPTWLMESLATLKPPGRFIISLNIGDFPLRWIAGEDYARQVSAALRSGASVNRVYVPQGPELATINDAVRRFAQAWPGGLHVIPASLALMRFGRPFSGKMHYLTSLLDMTRDHFARLDRQVFATDLPQSHMKIEDYVGYIQRTGDVPRK